MIITLSGSNAFALKSEVDARAGAFIKAHGDFGLQRIDGETADYDQIREALEAMPFLATNKMVVLRTPGANKQFTEKAESLLKALDDATDVIIIEPKLDKRSSYYKFLKKATDFKEFNELDENGLSRWLVERAQQLGATMSQPNARYLVERIGANQQMLAQEIEKLAVYDVVDRKLIDLLTEPTPQSTVFQLLDAVFAGKKNQALALYQEQRASKVEPQAIIAMLAWQLHVLALLKTAGDRADDQIARDAKLNPFVVRKSRAIASRLTPAKLKRIINDLVVLDRQLKTITIDADDALQAYLLSI